MPRTRLLLVLLIAAAMAPLSAPAAFGSGYSLYASYVSPDGADETFGLGLRYTLDLRSSQWAIELTSSYYDGLEAPVRVSEAVVLADDLRVVPLDLGLRYTWVRPGVEPYIGFGGTFARLRSDLGETDDETGGYAMFGLQWGDGRGPGLFVEGQYRYLSEVAIKLFPSQPDSQQPRVDLSGFAVNLGVSWNL